MIPKLSIIIPTYNEEDDIGKCIISLRQQSYKDFEIIIVDDGSTDATRRTIELFQDIKLIHGEHKGTGLSRNLGAMESKGEILIFVDADMTFDKNYLKNLIKPMIENNNIIGTTHQREIAINIENNVWAKCWGKERINKENKKNPKIFRAIRRNKFLQMGGFNSKYGYADDQTFYLKFNKTPIYAINTICYHNNPETLEETFNHAKWIGSSWKERFGIFRIKGINHLAIFIFKISIPFLVIKKSLKVIEGVSLENRIKFYWYKLNGFHKGIKKAIILGEIYK